MKNIYVLLIYKQGNRNNPLNYRPISLTSSFFRSFEPIISLKILNHLFSNNITSPKQFGFLFKRTSCTQLLNCFHTWLVSFFTNKYINITFTDIQKALDSFSHLKLTKTLSQYRINRILVEWLKNFFRVEHQE